MDLRNMLRIIGGHPVVVGLGLLVTLLVAGFLVSRISPEYEARASVLLFPPSNVETPEGSFNRNGLENAQGVAVVANALTDKMSSAAFAQRLADAGLAGSYEVVVNPSGGPALLSLRTTGATGIDTLSGLEMLRQELEVELDDIQRRASVEPEQRILSQVNSMSTEATPITGSKARVLAITLSLGLVGSYGLAVLADALYGERQILRERLKRRGGRHLAPKGETTPDVVAPDPERDLRWRETG